MAPLCKGKLPTHTPLHGSLVQRELSAQLTEGLSVRATICYIENGLSYPLRHFVTPPLTIRGGMVVGGFVPPVKKGKQEGGINEVLSVRRAKDKKPAQATQGAYIEVRDQGARKGDTVFRDV